MPAVKKSVSDFIDLRGKRSHVRIWGDSGAPRLFLLHGWKDISASFQFVVDELRREWRVIAPDWRGFGASDGNAGPYWFPDYLADLDGLLDHYSPDEPARIAGHSMGGNVAGLYAGVRSGRVAQLALLEGLGLAASDPAEAPHRFSRWLEQVTATPKVHAYVDRPSLAARLMAANPRLTATRAAFLAEHLGVSGGDGRIVVAADPYHNVVNPVLYRLEEAKACWRRVTAPVLWVAGTESPILRGLREHEDDYRERLACFADLREAIVPDAGHNLHHDQPARLASLLEHFFAS